MQPVSALGESVNKAVSMKPRRSGVFLLLVTLAIPAFSPVSSLRTQRQERAGLLPTFPPSLGCMSHHRGIPSAKPTSLNSPNARAFQPPNDRESHSLIWPSMKRAEKTTLYLQTKTPIALASK